MSMWLPPSAVPADDAGVGRLGPARWAGRDPLRIPSAFAIVAIGAVLVVWESRFRQVEARVSAVVLRLVHLRPAQSLGDSVIFPLRGHWVGYTLNVSCTAALLVSPFMVVAAGLLASGRVNRRRALSSLGVVAAIIFAINQLRFMVIAGSMVLWGFRIGYERSHVLIGTVLSTLGLVVGVIIFIWMLVEGPKVGPASAEGGQA
ncbi:MAG: exosortase/archaeosortase family protein [Actinomycetota bacterium]|nr:exosortase/archaeosortase family protein [Actinomycetota bacterium]